MRDNRFGYSNKKTFNSLMVLYFSIKKKNKHQTVYPDIAQMVRAAVCSTAGPPFESGCREKC